MRVFFWAGLNKKARGRAGHACPETMGPSLQGFPIYDLQEQGGDQHASPSHQPSYDDACAHHRRRAEHATISAPSSRTELWIVPEPEPNRSCDQVCELATSLMPVDILVEF